MVRRCLLVLAVALAAAPAARADTIVFRRGSDVWLMAPDGSGQRAVTHGERPYEWPSASDDGTILAADDAGRLHRLRADGTAIGAPIPTAATAATEDEPAETPTHVRISPDGTRVAYDEVIDGDARTLWTPADATTLSFPGQTLGQEGLVAPSWIGNGQLLLSRDVTVSDEDEPELSLYTVGGGDNSAAPWFDDPGAPWATGFDAAAARTGTRIALMEDDAADSDGTPQRVVLRLFTIASPTAAPEFRCEIGLETADTYTSASPSFSPDGSRIAWAESDGIHVATLGSLADCGAIREQVVTLPGAWEPYWSPFDAPDPPAGTLSPARLTLTLKSRTRPHRTTLLKRGVRGRVTVSAPATVRLTVRVAGTKRVVARQHLQARQRRHDRASACACRPAPCGARSGSCCSRARTAPSPSRRRSARVDRAGRGRRPAALPRVRRAAGRGRTGAGVRARPPLRHRAPGLRVAAAAARGGTRGHGGDGRGARGVPGGRPLRTGGGRRGGGGARGARGAARRRPRGRHRLLPRGGAGRAARRDRRRARLLDARAPPGRPRPPSGRRDRVRHLARAAARRRNSGRDPQRLRPAQRARDRARAGARRHARRGHADRAPSPATCAARDAEGGGGQAGAPARRRCHRWRRSTAATSSSTWTSTTTASAR